MNKQETIIYDKNIKELKNIENNLPSGLREKLMITVMNTELEDSAKKLLENKDLASDIRKLLTDDLASGELRHEETIVDKEIEKKIDDYYEKAVKASIKSGTLSRPDDDPYFKKRMAAIDKKHKQNE